MGFDRLSRVRRVDDARSFGRARDCQPEDVEQTQEHLVVEILVKRFVERPIRAGSVFPPLGRVPHLADDPVELFDLGRCNAFDDVLDETVLKVGAYLREVSNRLRVREQPIRKIVNDRVEAEGLDEEPRTGARLR